MSRGTSFQGPIARRGAVCYKSAAPRGADYSIAASMFEFFRDLWDFLRERKKLWLLPIVLVLVLIGGLVVVSQQTVLGSFIYTLF